MIIKIFFSILIISVLLTSPTASKTVVHGGWSGSAVAGPLVTQPFTPTDVKNHNSDVPVAWFNLAYDLARDEHLSPPVAARLFGYLGVALYEALVPGMPEYQSLAGQLNGLQALSRPSDPSYHWPIVANSVLATIMRGILKSDSSSTHAAIHILEDQINHAYQPSLPPGVHKRSIGRGISVGQQILSWAESDGYEVFKNCPYHPQVGEGLWIPTPPGFNPPLQPCWGKLRPFVLNQGSDCSPAPHPFYSENPESVFYQEAFEVYQVVNNLAPEQLEIALFWADNPGQTGTPPGHSISILSQVLVQEESSLEMASEAYARVGIALADSFIACWDTKYKYNLLRPITYIHQVLGDEGWNTPVVTPPFPEYTSGHSVQSSAVAQVLTEMFGEVAFIDDTHASLGFDPREFENFFAFAQESAISRLYGGIHFRSAIELGMEQGHCIGEKVSKVKFKK
jgi:hypothetical protein